MKTIKSDNKVVLSEAERKPSLLRQIIDEIDEMEIEKKEQLLWKLKMDKALLQSQKADEAFKDKFKNMSDTEIADLVSKNRKAAYEQKVHH